MSRTTGIQIRHSRSCPAGSNKDAACKCHPSYRAEVYDRRAGEKIRKTFPTLAAAKAWRADSVGEVRRGKLRAVPPITLRAAAEAWLEGAKSGAIRTRSGDPYKPSCIRGYEQALTQRILPEFGGGKLGDIRRTDLQDFADGLLAEGLDPSTIKNALMPVRAIYRRAAARGEVAINPTTGLELAAVRGRRDRVASVEEAAALLEALPLEDRGLWATACYAGLRLGELRALRVEDVDRTAKILDVRRSWDQHAGEVAPKSLKGTRKVPIPEVLLPFVLDHLMRTGRRGGLVFGRTETTPFNPSSVSLRAATAWKKANQKRAELELAALRPITLHECRHTYASLMIAAGVNAKALSTYMGHSSVTITYDRYGHLMPGNEEEAAALLDAYLVEAGTKARAAAVTS
jgi:integrase